MSNGFIVVVQAGNVDPSLVSGLINRLVSEGVDVIPAESSSDFDLLAKAAGVALVLGDGADGELEHMYGVRASMEHGTLLPITLTSPTELSDLEGLRPIDLSRWTDEDDPELERLVGIVQAVVTNHRPRNAPGWSSGNAPRAVEELRKLTREVTQLGEILIDDEPHRRDLIAALDEVGATYRAVNEEIAAFAEVLHNQAQLQRSRIHQLARANLMERIHNGRGSCTRIGTLYKRTGGIREALVRKETPDDLLSAADAAFGRLTSSDMDLFAAMESVGETLKTHARAIENLLIMEQTVAAEARMRVAWHDIAPLEKQLEQARNELQSQQASLGYVEQSRELTGGAKVTVLFVASSPDNLDPLRIDKEMREIQQRVRMADHRDSLRFDFAVAAQPSDLLQRLNEVKPDVVHFSGHSGQAGLAMEDAGGGTRILRPDELATLLKFSIRRVRFAVFNSCESAEHAASAVQHIDAAIGMNQPITDDAAKTFAAQLYSSIAFGLSLEKAFAQAGLHVQLSLGRSSGEPLLYVADGLNAEDIYLVGAP